MYMVIVDYDWGTRGNRQKEIYFFQRRPRKDRLSKKLQVCSEGITISEIQVCESLKSLDVIKPIEFTEPHGV